MLSTTKKFFILVQNHQIQATTNTWDDMRDYCSETQQCGEIFVVETFIPFGHTMERVTTTQKFFGKI